MKKWELKWEHAAQTPWFEVWGTAWCGFVGTLGEIFPSDVVTVLLLCCRNDAPGVPRAVPAALSPICHRAESPREGLVLNTVEHKVSSALWCFEREDEESTLLLNFFLSRSVAVTSTALEWKGRTGMGFEVTIRVLVAPSPNMNIISKSKTFKFVEITWNLNIDC